MNPIIIHHRSSHHAKNSGYARLLDFIDATQIPSGKKVLPYRVAKLIGGIVKQNAGLYDTTSVLKDVELYKTFKKSKKKHTVVHYLNAERDVRYTISKSKNYKDTSFCATFHKPQEILTATITDNRYLRKLNGAIAVGANQVDFLKNWLDIDNVQYIPHGVDSTFFKEDYTKRKENNLLFVGQHLRDFDALNYCIPKIAERVENFTIHIVLRKDFSKYIIPHPSISIHSGINDVQLKAFYQEATALFLPLKNVTACNSILEAMACGVPIITTAVGGNLEYLKNTRSILAPINAYDSLIEKTIDLLKDESKIERMSKASLMRSADYDWSVISKKVLSFYETLNNNY